MLFALVKRTRIRTLHIIGILITVLTVSAALFWMSNRHNEQAAFDSQRMVTGGVLALQEQTHVLARDYSWWQSAYDGILAGDDDWVFDNMGYGITDGTNAADIMVIVNSSLRPLYGWQIEIWDAPATSILDEATIGQLASLLADVPVEPVGARSGFFNLDGQVAILAVSRVLPEDVEGFDAAHAPLLIMGMILTPEIIGGIGESFLVENLTIDLHHQNGRTMLPLLGLDGRTVAYLHWTPPTPGTALLSQAAWPVSVLLALFALTGFAAANRAQMSADQLAASEKEANVAARRDSLSGLPNRLSFSERLALPETQEAAARGELAVVFADVNGFKLVNDTVGHAGGDRLVQALAKRLGNDLREDAFLARVGGDEFNVLVIDRNAEAAAKAIAERMVGSFEHVFGVDGASFHITAGIGFATSKGGLDGIEVVRRADVAMYRAKEHRTHAPLAYEASFESNSARKKEIEQALRIGLQTGELTVFYQPIVDSGGHGMVSAEALLRWNSAALGSVGPNEFIPVAEETGMVVDIGQFVLKQACEDMAEWPELKVSVNVSPVELREPAFVEDASAIVTRAGISPDRIEFELTEGILVSHPELAAQKLAQLKAAGFTIALDDFGTGFSSIGYLRQMPFDKLKIDRSFVSNAGQSDSANGLLLTLIKLGHALDLEVVSEGVEDKDQANLMHLAGSGLLQGFYFAKALPIAELRDSYGETGAAGIAAAS